MKNVIIIPILLISCFFSLKLTAQKTKIKVADLPEGIQVQLNKKYSKYQTNSIFKTTNKSHIQYDIELVKKNKLLYLEFDTSGILLYSEKSHVYTFDGTEPVKNKSSNSDGHNHTH